MTPAEILPYLTAVIGSLIVCVLNGINNDAAGGTATQAGQAGFFIVEYFS